ncbi:hypothetical protein [Cellulomonas sp. SG140]|uniref:hypothetical protein n=1 Tax=Cellulomonas sp. SG140 TaxID=2976536 RepID=UPI0021E8C59D|nr:hypothetical protein [Cellulomonas sp. SG140]
MVHQIVKPEKIAATAAVLLEQSLTVPAVFQREGIDQYKGAEDDTINVTVEGVLPFRTYGWRNDRSSSIVFDEYKERKVPVTFGGDAYNAVRLTDEQNDFDLKGWTKLARKQTEALAKGLNFEAADYLSKAQYDVVLGVPEYAMRWALIRARAMLNRLQAPGTRRTLLVGTDWESTLLEDEKLNLAQNVGESEAVSALRDASLGRRYGFDIVVAQEIDPTDAFALVDSAFIFANGAPSVPQSVPFGATSSYEGVALRWLRDYETEKMRDRSVFNTYRGFRNVRDVLVGRDPNTKQAFVGDFDHFVRAIKLELTPDKASATAATVVPKVTAGTTEAEKRATELATITGVKAPTIPDAPTA